MYQEKASNMKSLKVITTTLCLTLPQHLANAQITTTPAPTTTSQAANAWKIGIQKDSVQIGFDDIMSSNELKFNLNITEGQSNQLQPLMVFDYDTCGTTQYTSDIIRLNYDSSNPVDVQNGFEAVSTIVDIQTGKLNDVQYYGSIYTVDPDVLDRSNIRFCILADLGDVEIIGATATQRSSVSYAKLRFDITVDMSQGFDSVQVDVSETTPETESVEAGLSYTVEVCDCDLMNGQCYSEPVAHTQNSALNICLKSLSESVVIKDIKTLNIFQESSGITNSVINDYITNSITMKGTLRDEYHLVSTRLVSVLFDNPTPVTVSGVAIMEFSSSRRRVLSNLRGAKSINRQLEENEERFSLDVSLSSTENRNGYSSSGISMNVSVVMAFMIGFCFIALA